MTKNDQDCIFCKIINGQLPSKKILENDFAVVFRDIAPKAPQHVLVVPKKHIESLSAATKDHEELLGKLMLLVSKTARKLGIEDAFQVKLYNGERAGQMVFHLHIHVLGGWEVRVNGHSDKVQTR